MPNHVTNRLEINADRETVQKVMNFLKGKTDDDNTPCYIDFNNIIPMPEELLIEKSSSGDLGMKYLEAMQLKPFYFLLDDDALRTIQWIEGLAEKRMQGGALSDWRQTLLCRWFSQPFGRLRDTQQAEIGRAHV